MFEFLYTKLTSFKLKLSFEIFTLELIELIWSISFKLIFEFFNEKSMLFFDIIKSLMSKLILLALSELIILKSFKRSVFIDSLFLLLREYDFSISSKSLKFSKMNNPFWITILSKSYSLFIKAFWTLVGFIKTLGE